MQTSVCIRPRRGLFSETLKVHSGTKNKKIVPRQAGLAQGSREWSNPFILTKTHTQRSPHQGELLPLGLVCRNKKSIFSRGHLQNVLYVRPPLNAMDAEANNTRHNTERQSVCTDDQALDISYDIDGQRGSLLLHLNNLGTIRVHDGQATHEIPNADLKTFNWILACDSNQLREHLILTEIDVPRDNDIRR